MNVEMHAMCRINHSSAAGRQQLAEIIAEPATIVGKGF
jgi:hypothetical protein